MLQLMSGGAHLQAYFASLEIDSSDAWTLISLLDADAQHSS